MDKHKLWIPVPPKLTRKGRKEFIKRVTGVLSFNWRTSTVVEIYAVTLPQVLPTLRWFKVGAIFRLKQEG